MNHRVRGRRLGRSSSHRKALSRNLVSALFRHGRIVTTTIKAKEYKPMAEKLITLAKVKNVHNVRRAIQILGDREAVTRLFDVIGPAFVNRPGGYCRIVKLATPRLGDKGPRAILEMINYVPGGDGSSGDGSSSDAVEGAEGKAAVAADS